MQRRTALKGLGGAATAVALPATARAAGGAGATVAPVADELDALKQPLMNTAQAQAVMEEYDLAGMLALNPVNIYYLTNTIPIGAKMRWEYPSFASLPRDADQPRFLVTTTAQLWDIVNGDRWVPDVIPYSGPANAAAYMGPDAKPLSEPPVAANRGYVVRDDLVLGAREQRWAASQANVQPSPTPEWALARAMKESGITKGRVAVDDMRIKTPAGAHRPGGQHRIRRRRQSVPAHPLHQIRAPRSNSCASPGRRTRTRPWRRRGRSSAA